MSRGPTPGPRITPTRRATGENSGVPRYSIVIAVHALTDTVEHALATVLAQTVDRFEVMSLGADGAAAPRARLAGPARRVRSRG
jgi:hypothetical protein